MGASADVQSENGPKRSFWDALAYTKIVNWGRHLFNGRYYVIRNELEAEGHIPYQPRKTRMRP